MFKFYHQESSVYFHFGYRLHQKLGDDLKGRIAGDSLFISVQDNVSVLQPLQHDQYPKLPNHSLVPSMATCSTTNTSTDQMDALSVCCNLLKFGCIELAAFRASFFDLFNEPEA